jgi:SAM-dependent methyltransferase
MAVQLDEFTALQRAVWDMGDYTVFADQISDVGELVAARADIAPGASVLDVACGTGNAAIPAARAGGRVTGLDLSPHLLEQAREGAAAAGAEIETVEGDAERLPFDDGSFDRVVSTFGHMFAPRHQPVADEMARVCASRGMIVTATWTPDSVGTAVQRAAMSFVPPPPDFAQPPPLWGTEDHVREMFGSAEDFRFERHTTWLEADSLDDYADAFLTRFPPMVALAAALGDRFPEVREAVTGIWRDANQAEGGAMRVPQEYLLSIIRF